MKQDQVQIIIQTGIFLPETCPALNGILPDTTVAALLPDPIDIQDQIQDIQHCHIVLDEIHQTTNDLPGMTGAALLLDPIN